ncbi:hypothetical protein BR93DRAFT_941381 [Coniochaeta sp. PMI_546]|nr:hypothetical protein BR93DRAFT_941381 [Coniochaeta sp. PMI_546]
MVGRTNLIIAVVVPLSVVICLIPYGVWFLSRSLTLDTALSSTADTESISDNHDYGIPLDAYGPLGHAAPPLVVPQPGTIQYLPSPLSYPSISQSYDSTVYQPGGIQYYQPAVQDQQLHELRHEISMQAPRGITDAGEPPSDSSIRHGASTFTSADDNCPHSRLRSATKRLAVNYRVQMAVQG